MDAKSHWLHLFDFSNGGWQLAREQVERLMNIVLTVNTACSSGPSGTLALSYLASSRTIISFLRSSPLLCDMQLLPLEPEAALMGYEVYT